MTSKPVNCTLRIISNYNDQSLMMEYRRLCVVLRLLIDCVNLPENRVFMCTCSDCSKALWYLWCCGSSVYIIYFLTYLLQLNIMFCFHVIGWLQWGLFVVWLQEMIIRYLNVCLLMQMSCNCCLLLCLMLFMGRRITFCIVLEQFRVFKYRNCESCRV